MSETAMLEPDGEAPDARALAARVKRLEALLREARWWFPASDAEPGWSEPEYDLARRFDAALPKGGDGE